MQKPFKQTILKDVLMIHLRIKKLPDVTLLIFFLLQGTGVFAQGGTPHGKVVEVNYEGTHHESCKNGFANGEEVYYFNDQTYFSGNFQDGIKERKNYKTYNFVTSVTFDSYKIAPSEQSENTLSIKISTTTASPNGTAVSLNKNSGYVLSLSDIVATNNCILTKIVSNTTTSKSLYKYMLSKFPATLLLILSDGKTIESDLYKTAKWNVRLYLNT